MRNCGTTFACLLLTIGGSGAVHAGGHHLPITGQQAARIDAAVPVKVPNRALAQVLHEAGDSIKAFVKTTSCLPADDASALNAWAAPGKSFPANNYTNSPVHAMPSHDKNSCASVARIDAFNLRGNALRFEVLYVSENSGQSTRTRHELRRQPSGQWLFAR